MSKVPCGGFKLDNNFLGMNENDELSLVGGGSEGKAYQQLVTDGDGNVKWEDRLAYEVTGWKDFVLNSSQKEITGFTMPPIGDTVTVKVNGVESVETVKSGEIEGQSYPYIGSTDIAGLNSGDRGWIVYVAVLEGKSYTIGIAIPETTISLLITEQHKIDEKYIQQDKNFVRPLTYYIGGYTLFKHYYTKSGEEITAYKCNSIKHLPHNGETVVYDQNKIGLGQIGSVTNNTFIITIFILTPSGSSGLRCIYGTDETEIAKLAARYGYTLTTKPTT